MSKRPADLVTSQVAKDLLFCPNRYRLDTRFLLKDGEKHPVAVICPGGSYA